ncbi:MAG: response regulator [Clostridia bacterium]|nr:response regulator [Clostridia bacterium]
MNKIRLLIADSDVRLTEQIASCLNSYADIEVVATEQNGRDALKRIRSLRPDAVLFELLLPGLDGLSLLRSIREMDDTPATICCTSMYSDVSVEAARLCGISYLVYKPFEPRSLHPILVSCTDIHRNLKRLNHEAFAGNNDPEAQSAFIRNYIVSLGVPTKLIGCSYLTEAVRLARIDGSLLRNLSKGLYLEIARSMDTTPSRIERCIRTAISDAYHNSDLCSRMPTCPTNKEFINYILCNIQA